MLSATAPWPAVFGAGLIAGLTSVRMARWRSGRRPGQVLPDARPRGTAPDGMVRVGTLGNGTSGRSTSWPDGVLSAAGRDALPPAEQSKLGRSPAVTRLTAAGHEQDGAGLRISLLGPLSVNGKSGALLPAQSELLVALAVNGRGGLSIRQLCRLLGPDAGRARPSDAVRQLIVRTRRTLGAPPGGRQWIEHLGHGRYALHPDAIVDLREFEALASGGIRPSSSDGLAKALATALDLIRGQPFADCYYWWLDHDVIATVTVSIVEVAATLASLLLAAGDPVGAARAARTGLTADPAAERLWRAVLRAEHAAGNRAGMREAWQRLTGAVADVAADGEPERSTVTLYRELLGAGLKPAVDDRS